MSLGWGGLIPHIQGSAPGPKKSLPLGKQAQAGQGLCLVASSSGSVAELDPGPEFSATAPRAFAPHTLLAPPSPTGLLNPLDSPHHMRQDEESEFREGVVVDRPTRPGHGSFVNCGMKKVGV